jgi:hypothetical protein
MSKLTWRSVRPHAGSSLALTLALLLAAIGNAPDARAFEFQDGRLQIHGYFEEQIRAFGQDLSWNDNVDLTQWYNVLSTEIEYDFAPDGFGPFDVLSGFVRLEVRYDCIWTRGCGMFPSVNAFGDRVAHLPGYKTTGRRTGMSGGLSIRDQLVTDYSVLGDPETDSDVTARFTSVKYEPSSDFRTPSQDNPPVEGCGEGRDQNNLLQPLRCRSLYRSENPRKPMSIDQLDGFTGLFAVAGSNRSFEANGNVTEPQQAGSTFFALNDDPAYFYFSRQLGCRFGSRKTPGGANGLSNQIIGPIDPNCRIDPSGGMIHKPNPFNSLDLNPIVVNSVSGDVIPGSAEMPGRPASEFSIDQDGRFARSRGVYYPSGAYRDFLKSGRDSVFDQNFSQDELAWNRGGSQQDEKEFKEGYLDMEFFDSRLWVRAGKQNIVWGKTELFRTTDQFNPADLALASLPSLEESRIALWSVRGVWSFYDIGPLEDVRLELAVNLDDVEPADIGRCGEPFTALVACNKTTALWAHGLFGVALAGERRAESWWKSASGLEYGGRLEFRTGRFSFQISDFYGYEDLPYVNRINSFERRVDAETGRPVRAKATGRCTTGFEDDCLPINSTLSLGAQDPKATQQVDDPSTPAVREDPQNNGALVPTANATRESRRNTLEAMAANIQIFGAICATSIGFNTTDPQACGQSVFNSQVQIPPTTPPSYVDASFRKIGAVSSLLANAIAGNPQSSLIVTNFFTDGVVTPYIRLNADPCDRFLSMGDGTCADGQGGRPYILGRGPSQFAGANNTLNLFLSDEQESLLGCGPFWGTDCEADGIDLLNAEASVIMQAFPGFEGNYGKKIRNNNFLGFCYSQTDGSCIPSVAPGTNAIPGSGQRDFEGAIAGARWHDNRTVVLPGARGPDQRGYNANQDGCVGPGPAGCNGYSIMVPGPGGLTARAFPAATALVLPAGFGANSGRPFKSEMAALSWNFLMTLVAFSSAPSEDFVDQNGNLVTDRVPDQNQFDPLNPNRTGPGLCSFQQPQYCSSVISFFSITGAQRNSLRAGGNGEFGRRDFQWHAGGEGVLQYQKRNVLGFSLDFAEDVTKSNWGMEATWISNVRFTDNNSLQGVNTGDTFNVTVSVDRPTFINFLNQNRTFFFNSQVFFQYINNYKSGFVNNGPFNMLGTFTIQTGYFQDRLLPNVTFVYDLNSNSGAALPSITYRFTENFSATVGMNFFWGRWEYEDSAIAPLGTIGTEQGKLAYRDGVENGLAVVRERDEVFLRLRYTF